MNFDTEKMKEKASEASCLLGSMANDKRLMILCQLVEGEKSVGQLADVLGVRQSTVSQHLALLRRDGLVAPRRDAQTQYYSLKGDSARAVLQTLYLEFCAPSALSETIG